MNDGYDMRSVRSMTGRGLPSGVASSMHISIWASSRRSKFFSEGELSFGGWPIWG